MTPDRPSGADHPNLALWRYRLVEAWLESGRPDDALALLDRAAAAAGPPTGGTDPADLARLRARALHRLGDERGAEAAFATAMTTQRDHDGSSVGRNESKDSSVGLAEALLALDYGRFQLEIGRPAAALDPLRSARVTLDRLGAAGFRSACDRALADCGAIPDTEVPAPVPGADALSARERVIARLVGDGATNREVAAQLYLSVKGVEYHLSNIFAKLGITSRRELRPGLAGHAPGPAGQRRPTRLFED